MARAHRRIRHTGRLVSIASDRHVGPTIAKKVDVPRRRKLAKDERPQMVDHDVTGRAALAWRLHARFRRRSL